MTAFDDLLADPDAEKRFICHLEPYDPATPGVVNLYYSSHGFTSAPGDNPVNQHYESRINDSIDIRRSLFTNGKLSGRSTTEVGSISLNNQDGALDALATYAWGGRRIRIWMGGKDFALADYGLIFDGAADTTEHRDDAVVITMRDYSFILDRDIKTGVLGASFDGTPFPVAFGLSRNVTPLFTGINSGNYEYFYNSSFSVAVLQVRDRGVPLTLVASAPSAGEWTYTQSSSQIVLGGAPDGIVTCDVVGTSIVEAASTTSNTIGTGSKSWTLSSTPNFAVGMRVRIFRRVGAFADILTWMDGVVTSYVGAAITINVDDSSGSGTYTDWSVTAWGTAGSIIRLIGTLMGVTEFNEAAFAALDAALPDTAGKWISNGGNALQILDEIADGAGCWHGFNRNSEFEVGRIEEPGTPVATFDSSTILSIERRPTDDPIFRFTAAYQRNHTVMSQDQIAGAAPDPVFLTNEWLRSVETDATVQDAYPYANAIELGTIFDEEASAAAEAQRQMDLFGVRRDYFTVRTKSQPLSLELGETVTIEHDRYGLTAGRDFVLVDLDEDLDALEVTMGLWG